MKKIIIKYSLLLSIIFMIGCAEDKSSLVQEVDLVTFEGTVNKDFGVVIDGETTRDINVYATNTSSADRTFNILIDETTTVDPTAYSVPSTVSIPANSKAGMFSVTIKDINIVEGLLLVLSLDSSGDIITGESLVFDVFQVCATPETFLDITFDAYSEETSWEIYDDSGTILYSNAYGGGETSASEKFCLPNGSYSFIIYDSPYCDGICCTYGPGSYTLSNNGTIIKEGGSFGCSEVTEFTLNN